MSETKPPLNCDTEFLQRVLRIFISSSTIVFFWSRSTRLGRGRYLLDYHVGSYYDG